MPEEDYSDLDSERQRRLAEAADEQEGDRSPDKPLPAMPVKRATGFERFLEKGLAMAGNRGGGGKGKGGGAKYLEGWASGLTRGQAFEKARSMYAALNDEQRQGWEKQANMEDVRSKGEIKGEGEYRAGRAAALGLAQPAVSPAPGGSLVQNGDGSSRWVPDQSAKSALPAPPPMQQQGGAATGQPAESQPAVRQGAMPNAQASTRVAPVQAAPPSTGGTINGQPIASNQKPAGIYYGDQANGPMQQQVRGPDGNYVGVDTAKGMTPGSAALGLEPRQTPTSTPKQNNFSAVTPGSPVERVFGGASPTAVPQPIASPAAPTAMASASPPSVDQTMISSPVDAPVAPVAPVKRRAPNSLGGVAGRMVKNKLVGAATMITDPVVRAGRSLEATYDAVEGGIEKVGEVVGGITARVAKEKDDFIRGFRS